MSDPYAEYPDLRAVDSDDKDELAALEDAETIEGLTQGLWQRRKQRALTQKQVGEHMGLAQSSISSIDRGLTDPSLSVLMMYARAVGSRIAISLDGHDVRKDLTSPRSLRGEYMPDSVTPIVRYSPKPWAQPQPAETTEDAWAGVAEHG